MVEKGIKLWNINRMTDEEEITKNKNYPLI